MKLSGGGMAKIMAYHQSLAWHQQNNGARASMKAA
jgi:hypothetical protein